MPVPSSEILLSILILSIPSRIEKACNLIKTLEGQLGDRRSVEILMFNDNRSQTISEKRNVLLHAARGQFVCFLDDDDRVSTDYIDQLLTAIASDSKVDCISFNQFCSIDGEPMNVEFGMGNPHGILWRDPEKGGMLGDIKRPPYHMCAFRRDIAQSEDFNPMTGKNGQSHGEDFDWLMRLYPKIQTEHHIDAPLHNYVYDSKTTTSLVPQGNA
jgi:glycosyltransferase involved in cell wall biosynthesis